jgi:hypothetical protein
LKAGEKAGQVAIILSGWQFYCLEPVGELLVGQQT